MRSEEVHKAMIHGATKFELCQLGMRGGRNGCVTSGSTPRECIGVVLQGLAANPAASLEYHLSCCRMDHLRVGAHAIA